jgi:hypothetical protein
LRDRFILFENKILYDVKLIYINYFFIFVVGWGLSPLCTAAITGQLYQPQIMDDGHCGAIGGMNMGRGNRSTRIRLASIPLPPPQIPHGQTQARTRATAVGSQRLTAWAIARPKYNKTF